MNRPFCRLAVTLAVCLLIGCTEGGPSAGPVQGSRIGNSAARRQFTLSAEATRTPARLSIPIQGFFPEGIAHAANGTFYVGSYSDGRVVRQRPGSSVMEAFLPPRPPGRGIAGMKVQDSTNTLWLCELDLNGILPDELRAYDLATGALRGSWPLPPGGFANDLTLDPHGNVYVTDSFLGVIHRLRRGASQLEPWASDPRFLPSSYYPALNGIAWDNGVLYTVKYDSGELFRIGILPNGSAGAITRITTDSPIGYPDGILMLSPGVLLVVDNDNGRFLRVNLSGDTGQVTLLATGFDNPTTVALHDGDAFIVESQFDHFFGVDPTPPDLPFRVKRVWLR